MTPEDEEFEAIAKRQLEKQTVKEKPLCPDCITHKLSAAMWRNEAYKHAGTPLPWESEELLRKEYERGYADAMNWKVQNHLEHLPPKENA